MALNRPIISRIHVNQHNIRANRKNGTSLPVISIKRGGKTYTTNSVEILGPSRLVYSPDNPLSCGARLWIETTAPLGLDK